ncbi:MAG: glutamate-5-semialdehyde dehydrogenase [Ferrimicrobium sp.]
MTTGSPNDDLLRMGSAARQAARIVATRTGGERRLALVAMAGALREHSEIVLTANSRDLERAAKAGQSESELDRLRLDLDRVEQMAKGLESVSELADVVGQVVDGWVLPNGVFVRRVRVPLGVIGVIYENRPNVTADAAGLALYAGNAIMLRGSSHAQASNQAVVTALRSGLSRTDIPEDAVCLVGDTSRASARFFMQLDRYIDCLIPRGGPELIASVKENATVPTVIDGGGNCHIYLDADADSEKAVGIVVNAKMQRPGVCNAVETILVHRDRAGDLLPRLDKALVGVEIRGDGTVCDLITRAIAATEEDYAREFLDLIVAVRVVDSLEEAIDHIGTYGTGHSEAIITEDLGSARQFVSAVDAAAVLVNTSTRFVDGGQLGMGAEIGISTQKLHARGPMGLAHLTTVKLVIEGDGQIRY